MTHRLLSLWTGEDVARMFEREAILHPRWADVQNRTGLLRLLEGRFDEALKAFRVSLDINPHYDWAGINYVQVLALAGQTEAARAALDAWSAPKPWMREIALAYLDLMQGADAAGLARLEQVPEAVRGRREVQRLEIALAAAHDPARADAVWHRLCAGPGGDLAINLLHREGYADRTTAGMSLVAGLHQLVSAAARLNARMGHVELAQALMSVQPFLWDEPSVTLNQEAVLADILGNPKKAERLWHEATNADPEQPEPYMHLAYHWSAEGELEKAFHSVRETLKRAPRWADLQYQLGLLHVAFDQHAEALTAFEAALAINPHYAMARLERAMCFYHLSRWAEAREAFDDVLEGGIESGDLRMHSGLIYQAQENHAAANNEFRRAVDLSPRSADAHWHLAGALARLGRSAEAARHYRRVAELEPGTERARNATQEIHKKTARKKGDK